MECMTGKVEPEEGEINDLEEEEKIDIEEEVEDVEKVVYMLASSVSHIKDVFAMACDCLALQGRDDETKSAFERFSHF